MTEPEGIHNYTYDVLNRLIQASHPTLPTKSFSYDSVGNRTGATYDSANRLFEDNDFTSTYDANGNMISRTTKNQGLTTNYTYDAENQLIAIS